MHGIEAYRQLIDGLAGGCSPVVSRTASSRSTSSMGATATAYGSNATARAGSAANKQLKKVHNKLKETQLELFNVKKELKVRRSFPSPLPRTWPWH